MNLSGLADRHRIALSFVLPFVLLLAITAPSAEAAAVSAGDAHTCAVNAEGGAMCWGEGASGQLGDGNGISSESPVNVAGLNQGVTSIAAGDQHSCAIVSGAIKCWGYNGYKQLGANPPGFFVYEPVAVAGISGGATDISLGKSFSCAVVSGAAKCWGKNDIGQLGRDTSLNPDVNALDVDGMSTGVTAVSVGDDFACAIQNGVVKCWGHGLYGELGGSPGDSTNAAPELVLGLGAEPVTAIATGTYHGCAVQAGTLKCWGRNLGGEFGNGTLTGPPSGATAAGSGLFSITSISAGLNFTCAVASGATQCWGLNQFGGLGDGTSTASPTPRMVTGGETGSMVVTAGLQHACAVVNRSLRCWGSNSSGQLGIDTDRTTNVPTPVTAMDAGVTSIAAGVDHTCAVVSGSVKCWGDNDFRGLGNGTTIESSTPVQVDALAAGALGVAAGDDFSCATISGGARCWGAGAFGQLGNGSTVTSSNPVTVSGVGSGTSAIEAGDGHACAIVSGSTSCWGANSYGQLGRGSGSVFEASPAAVSGLTGVSKVSGGTSNSCAVSAGSAKCWGLNSSGQLGNGTTAPETAPVQVVGLTSGVTDISTGGATSCAVVTGSAKCWGNNFNGALGNGGTGLEDEPVQVTGLATGVTAISVGGSHSCAIVLGAVWCWGDNASGQLGNAGAGASSGTPVAVNSLDSGVTAISAGADHTCAIKSGALFCWGDRNSGQLGDGKFGYRTTAQALPGFVPWGLPVLPPAIAAPVPLSPIAGPVVPLPPRILQAPRRSRLSRNIRIRVSCPIGCELNLKIKIGRALHDLRTLKLSATTDRTVLIRVPGSLRRSAAKALRNNRRTKIKLYAQPVAGEQIGKTMTVRASSRKPLARSARVNVTCANACEAWSELRIGRARYLLRAIEIKDSASNEHRIVVKYPRALRRAAAKARRKSKRTKISLHVRVVENVQLGSARSVILK